MAGFKYVRSEDSKVQVLKKVTLKNSGTFTVGDVMKYASGFQDLVGAGNSVYGIIVDIVDFNGLPPRTNGAGGNFTDTYTTASDNQTVDKISALVDTSTDSVWRVTMDDTLGTTTGSNLEGGYNADVVAASDQLDESTTTASSAQFAIVGQYPGGATNEVLCKILESQK